MLEEHESIHVVPFIILQSDVNNVTPSLISIVGVYVELPNCPYKDN